MTSTECRKDIDMIFGTFSYERFIYNGGILPYKVRSVYRDLICRAIKETFKALTVFDFLKH